MLVTEGARSEMLACHAQGSVTTAAVVILGDKARYLLYSSYCLIAT